METIFNRKAFYDIIRDEVFGGGVSPTQVNATNVLLDFWEANHSNDDDRWLAYILATNFHETGGRMVSVREGFATTDAGARKVVAKRKYGQPDPVTGEVYYGRGRVQLTWADNYIEMGKILGLPLYEQPDLALDDQTSVEIMVEGMILGKSGKGDFTGKALSDYFNANKDDPVGARRIVNGLDRAQKIASYHEDFLHGLEVARLVAEQEREVLEAKKREAEKLYISGEPAKAAKVVAKAEAVAKANDKPEPDKPKLSKDRITIGTLVGSAGAGTVISKLGDVLNNPYALGGLALVIIAALLVLSGRIKIAKDWGI